MTTQEPPNLQQFFDAKEPINSAKLVQLSGLEAAQVEEVKGYWQAAPVFRKEALVDQMLTLIEDNVDMDFTAIFRLALDEPNSDIVVKAIDGLWECKERWLLERLITMAQTNSRDDVRAAAALGLGKFVLLGALEEIRPALLERVEQTLRDIIDNADEPVVIRRRAVEALSQSPDPAVHDVIRDAYSSAELDMKLAALYAMGQACDDGWLPVLLSEMHNEDPSIRYEAARATGELEDPRAIPALVELTKEDDPEIQEVSIEALGRIGGDEAKNALREIMSWPDARVKEAAALALEELTSSADPLSFPEEDDDK